MALQGFSYLCLHQHLSSLYTYLLLISTLPLSCVCICVSVCLFSLAVCGCHSNLKCLSWLLLRMQMISPYLSAIRCSLISVAYIMTLNKSHCNVSNSKISIKLRFFMAFHKYTAIVWEAMMSSIFSIIALMSDFTYNNTKTRSTLLQYSLYCLHVDIIADGWQTLKIIWY